MADVLTPRSTAPSVGSKKPLVFWKQIIPEQTIKYRNPKDGKVYRFDFNNGYHADVIKAFKGGLGPDQVVFQLADSKNSHGPANRDYSPEAQRGVTLDMTTYDLLPPKVKAEVDAWAAKHPAPNVRGVYAKVRMFDEKAAKVIHDNPGLAVSARIREGHVRADGVSEGRAVVHILGTIDSQIVGMAPWTEADLSWYPDDTGTIIDLSTQTWQEAARMPKQQGKGTGKGKGTAVADRLTPTQIRAMSNEDLAALAKELGIEDVDPAELTDPADLDDAGGDGGDGDDSGDDSGDGGDGGDGDGDEDGNDPVPSGRQLVGAGADLSNPAMRVAVAANQRANEALSQLAAGNWKNEVDRLIDAGVPPAAIDLCTPYLSAPGGFTVDLANADGDTDELDVAGDMRKLIGMFTDYVDLSAEAGHGGQFQQNQDQDPDKPVLDSWEQQFPSGR